MTFAPVRGTLKKMDQGKCRKSSLPKSTSSRTESAASCSSGDNEIGVFRHGGAFYAYSNFCLHQGGPACEGLTIARVEERLRPDKTSMGLYFSETEMHFVCPWHGMEYDITTGECVSDRRMKLKTYQVVQKGDEVYVVA